MTDADKIDLLLDDYLAGRLDPSAKAKLEIELAENPMLQQTLDLHKAANVLIREHKLKDVSALAQKIHKEESSFWNTYGFWIGGGLGVILGISVLLVVLKPSNENGIRQTSLPGNKQETTHTEPNTGAVLRSSSMTSIAAKGETKSIEVSTPTSSSSKNTSTGAAPMEVSQAATPTIQAETKSAEFQPVAPTQASGVAAKIADDKVSQKGNNISSRLCENVVIEAEVHTLPTCADGSTGKIEVKSIKGGSAPYHIDYFDAHGHALNPLESWGKGSYQLKIKDAHGCASVAFVALVKETICKEDVSFNPYVGEGWEGSGFGQEATIRIFDRNLGVIYEKRIPKGDHHVWDGRNTKGELAEGYFLFEITFADGGKKTGSVTVVR